MRDFLDALAERDERIKREERERVLARVEARRLHWFCSGDGCEPYDHGRDEGFDMALSAIREDKIDG